MTLQVIFNRRVVLAAMAIALGSCTTRAIEPTVAPVRSAIATRSMTAELIEAQPHPSLEPRKVVEYQLEALRFDSPLGYEIAFRFASPMNRANTGPVARFAMMIRSPGYNALLSFDWVAYFPAVLGDGVALQRVVVYNGGRHVVYDFLLRRQTAEGPYQDCWMTEAVFGAELEVPKPSGNII